MGFPPLYLFILQLIANIFVSITCIAYILLNSSSFSTTARNPVQNEWTCTSLLSYLTQIYFLQYLSIWIRHNQPLSPLPLSYLSTIFRIPSKRHLKNALQIKSITKLKSDQIVSKGKPENQIQKHIFLNSRKKYHEA